MIEDTLENLPGLFPIDFFSLGTDLRYSKTVPSSKLFRRQYILPDTSELLAEETFAEIGMVWNEEALIIEAFVDKPFEQCSFLKYEEGDSLELFFDTRDLKTAGFMTRFCHHFLILPKEDQGIGSREITHFRTEDTHPLSDPDELVVETHFGSSDYRLQAIIPAHCLHGYDPASFDRLGFTYRLNRAGGAPQHFAVSSKYYAVERHPSLWASLKLVK